MKRFLICALGVALLATPALAQTPPADVHYWLSGDDGSNKITLGVSQTAIVRVWASITANGSGLLPVTGFDLFLDGRNSVGVQGAESFNVVGFNDQVITDSQTQLQGRGGIYTDGTTNLPGSLNDYQLVFEDSSITVPLTDNEGVDSSTYPRASILLDEIVIHGKAVTESSDLINFGSPNPIYFALEKDFFGNRTGPTDFAATLGTGAFGNFLFVNVTPEPATLGLIALGGLAAFRRRR